MANRTRRASRERRDVEHYYDSNTRRFLALGGGARSLSIHRALWGPGVTDGEAAVNHINVLLGDAIESQRIRADATLIDLGCGVGGTLFALARRFPELRSHGITISARQCELARAFADALGLAKRCTFQSGDFESADLGFEANVAIAVESMVHAQSATAFLGNAFRHLAPGGMLVVVDDFVSASAQSNEATCNVLDDFRKGWHLSSLTTVPAFVGAAEAVGFALADVRDLSPLIRLDRRRDRIIGALGPRLRRWVHVPMFANLVGGAALTRGLREGLLSYSWLRFTRQPTQAASPAPEGSSAANE